MGRRTPLGSPEKAVACYHCKPEGTTQRCRTGVERFVSFFCKASDHRRRAFSLVRPTMPMTQLIDEPVIASEVKVSSATTVKIGSIGAGIFPDCRNRAAALPEYLLKMTPQGRPNSMQQHRARQHGKPKKHLQTKESQSAHRNRIR